MMNSLLDQWYALLKRHAPYSWLLAYRIALLRLVLRWPGLGVPILVLTFLVSYFTPLYLIVRLVPKIESVVPMALGLPPYAFGGMVALASGLLILVVFGPLLYIGTFSIFGDMRVAFMRGNRRVDAALAGLSSAETALSECRRPKAEIKW